MNIIDIRNAIAAQLPKSYEPLSLAFYGGAARTNGNYIVIGDDSFSDLCIDTRDNCLYAIDRQGKIPAKFVNSSLDQFIRFFNTYKEFSDKLDHAGENRRELLQTLRPRLTAIDGPALGDVDKWWEPAVEQLEDAD